MVEKFDAIIKVLEAHHDRLSLFVILKMDDFLDEWSVIVASDWIQEENRAEIFKELAALMKTHFSKEENEKIARIGIFPIDDYVSKLFLQFNEGDEIIAKKVNGFFVHEAIVLRSKNKVS